MTCKMLISRGFVIHRRFAFILDPATLTSMKSRSLSRQNAHLKGPDGRFLHARNVATSTAVETGKPVAAYVSRCMARLCDAQVGEQAPRFNLSVSRRESRGR